MGLNCLLACLLACFARIAAASFGSGGADPMACPHDWHRGVIGGFIDAVREDRAPAIPGHEELRVHHLIDALLRSARERRTISPAT